ncbi:MAG: LysR family transcriptional regulator [Hydrogenophaga sp.]|nr:LysR family transcriptional regulator [Hydrogenophaga sp.]
MLNLRRLQHFVVLAEEKNFSRAAQKLHLTQPALTRSIQTLEAALELVLVDRSHEGVSLTAVGHSMLARARRLQSEAQALQREAALLRGVEIGHIAFGVGVMPASIFLTEVLQTQMAQRPGLSVQVEIESWVRLLEKMTRDELDFVVAMTHSLPPPPGYTVEPLPHLHISYLVRAGHRLATLGPREIRPRLREFPLLAPQIPPAAEPSLAALYALDSTRTIRGLRCDNIDILRSVALASDAILFAARETFQDDIQAGRLCPLPLLRAERSQLPLSLIYPERRSLAPAAKWMIGLIQSTLYKPHCDT